ncbi:AN1 zinc finger protein [Phyllosticta citriasiana]|uniref:AN1 zinc finger protein n=1 Tax=Phyllosticta citriasiana TaxID=595635 RepID=UPI0030FD546F
MASATPPGDNPQSYTTMSVGDVEAIGAHCQMAFCHQLDFLPFKCESCKGTFCLDHRTETTHKCSKAVAWARSRREASSTPSSVSSAPRPNILNHEQQCSSPVCKTLINTSLAPGIHCPDCNRQYCLKHRMREEHDCAQADSTRRTTRRNIQGERVGGAGEKAAVSETAKKTSFGPKTNSPAARAAAINTLKKTAQGDAQTSADTTNPLNIRRATSFTTSRWSVGRILDMAAKELQVENVNNRGGGEKDRLRVFHVEGGRLLDFSEKIGKACQTGNTIVLLRGVGPPVPDLIEA